MSAADEVRLLEEQLLRTDFRRNRAAVAALLADEFCEFGSSGCVWNKQQILDKLEAEPSFEAAIDEFQARELSTGVVLATYRLTIQNPVGKATRSLRSSLWISREGRWQILFHQGTPRLLRIGV